MTPRQKRFIEEYLIDQNGTQAAIRAGYAPKNARTTGAKLLAHSNIAKSLAEKQREASEKASVTLQDVINGLRKEAMFTGKGSAHSARVSAWSHLAKVLGYVIERHEHTGKDGKPIETRHYADSTDAELTSVYDSDVRASAETTTKH